MNNIEKLIKELCPNGVEWRELGGVAKIEIGKQLNRTLLFDNGTYPVQNGGIEPSGFYDEYNTDENTITISQGGASAGFVNFITDKFWAGAHCYVIKETDDVLLYKYVYYVLKNGQMILQNSKLGAGIPGLNRSTLSKFPIPIPPLPIQQEIVNILDKFTALEAELQAELEARRKQYEYYREKLLTFSEIETSRGGVSSLLSASYVEWKTLGVVAEIYDGTHQTPKYTDKGVKFVSVENIKSLYETKKYISEDDYDMLYKNKPKKDDVFMTRIGTIGTCSIVENNDKLAYYVTLTLIRPNHDIVKSRFIKYYIESYKGQTELRKRTLINAVPIKINLGEIGKISIPIPPLSEQNRIVGILDKFEELVNQSLPAEIEARRKQYEYYREKLLTFA